MAAQPAPLESQRSHWYANVIRFALHVPGEAVSALPTTAAPLIVGGETFAGGCWPGADARPLAALVTRIVVTSATVTAVATWRLIALLASGCMNRLVTLGWGRSRVWFTLFVEAGRFRYEDRVRTGHAAAASGALSFRGAQLLHREVGKP